jgi:PAS domain S-box-containing protein
MGQVIAQFDWRSVGLPLNAWPAPLRHAVSIVLRSALPMLVLWGPQKRLIYNMAYAEILGSKRLTAMGRPFFEVWPQVSPAGRDLLEATFRGASSVHSEAPIQLLRDDGQVDERWFSFWQVPIVGEDDCVGGILSGCIDVSERVRDQAALGDREAHLTLALAAGRIAPWVVDRRSGEAISSPELNSMLGLPDDAKPTLAELTAGYFPGEMERVQAAANEALANGRTHYEIEYRHVRANDGAVRWLLLRAHIERSPEGEPTRTIGVVVDVTHQKEAEERLRLLAREVDHRANNLLTVVQGLVQLDISKDVPTYRASLMGRISALGHAHRLLSENRWTGASLKQLINEELGPYFAGDRVKVRCLSRDVLLSPVVAQSVAMALHELATNASKYGALSVPNGAVRLSCARMAPDRMALTWAESGGPRVERPSREGVGLGVITRAIAGAPGGAVRLDWLPQGLRCQIEFGAQEKPPSAGARTASVGAKRLTP